MDLISLDPGIGGTIWARRLDDYTVELRLGNDPDAPYDTVVMSQGEIERLAEEFA